MFSDGKIWLNDFKGFWAYVRDFKQLVEPREAPMFFSIANNGLGYSFTDKRDLDEFFLGGAIEVQRAWSCGREDRPEG